MNREQKKNKNDKTQAYSNFFQKHFFHVFKNNVHYKKR